MSAAEQIQALTKTLEEANYHYYVLDVPHKAGGRPGTESV